MSEPRDRSFKADDPVHIVRNEMRRHCLGLDFPSASPTELSRITEEGYLKKGLTGTDVALTGL